MHLSWSQLKLNLIFPDYSIIDSDKGINKESTDWEFVKVRMEVKDLNSVFTIDFMDQNEYGEFKTKHYELIQNSEWLTQDGIDICYVTTKDKSKKYLFYFMMPTIATNQVWISLSEIDGLIPKGEAIHLKNFAKNQRETLLFLSDDGLSTYQYVNNFTNELRSERLNFARKFSEDSIKLCYTSQQAILRDSKDFLYVTTPVEVPFQSTLIHRNISRNLSFNEGVYTYRNDSILNEVNHQYGMSSGSNEGFEKFKYAWFVPDNIELLSYKANGKGSWEKVDNSVIFSGEIGINNVLVEIKFRIKNTQAKEIEKTKVEVKETITVPNKKVKISVWDNRREDGDIISLSLNGEWIIRNLEVKKCQTTFTIDLPHEENFLIMKAENLGSSPPNTAAFNISSGDFNKQVILNSDMGKSEMIILKLNE
jgi:hypothetical protein